MINPRDKIEGQDWQDCSRGILAAQYRVADALSDYQATTASLLRRHKGRGAKTSATGNKSQVRFQGRKLSGVSDDTDDTLFGGSLLDPLMACIWYCQEKETVFRVIEVGTYTIYVNDKDSEDEAKFTTEVHEVASYVDNRKYATPILVLVEDVEWSTTSKVRRWVEENDTWRKSGT